MDIQCRSRLGCGFVSCDDGCNNLVSNEDL